MPATPSSAVPAWLRAWPASLILLGFAVAGTYLHTLDVPFYLDDYSSIVENDLVVRWQGFGPLWHYAPLRILCYASFALNHAVGGLAPPGYHLVNIFIHFLAGVALFALTRGLLRTPRMAGAAGRPLVAALPLLAAALFLVHPLQTQAVTYVVQRLASMAAMFYLGALACHVQARLAPTVARRVQWTLVALALGGLAIFTKENAVTLPAAIVLIDLTFFPQDRRSATRLLVAALFGAALVWLLAAIAFQGNPLSLRSMDTLAAQTTTIPRASYLATQLPILWTYVRLFVLPAGLHLDYADGPLRGFGEAMPWLALAAHLGVIALAVAAWRRRPIVTFGVLFCYLAHAVESSVIPIPELAFEHRTYLPNAGLCLVAGWALLAELPRLSRRPAPAVAVSLIVVLLLAVATWRRNQLWLDPVAFWRGNVMEAPTKARAWGNLGKHLVQAGRAEEGVTALHESMRLRRAAGTPDEPLDVVNLSIALETLGRGAEALSLVEGGLQQTTEPGARALLLLQRGNIDFNRDRVADAEAFYREALRLQPHSLPVQANLASALARAGRYAEAESLFAAVLRANPGDATVRRNMLLARVGRVRQAVDAFDGVDPGQAAQANQSTIEILEELVRQNPSDPLMRRNLERARAAARDSSP